MTDAQTVVSDTIRLSTGGMTMTDSVGLDEVVVKRRRTPVANSRWSDLHPVELATVGGALLGGAAGVGAGDLASRQTGLQITVRYDNGSEEVIVQGKDPYIAPGQRVRIIVGADGSRRVEPEY